MFKSNRFVNAMHNLSIIIYYSVGLNNVERYLIFIIGQLRCKSAVDLKNGVKGSWLQAQSFVAEMVLGPVVTTTICNFYTRQLVVEPEHLGDE